MNLYDKKAKFEHVIESESALIYHAEKFQRGMRYELAKLCFQYCQIKGIKIA